MIFVLAPDSFKGSLTAHKVCKAMERGIHSVLPDACCIHVPMADGGEGTVQSLVDATGGTLHHLTVVGPLGTPVPATFGLSGDERTAYIEMASASGMQWVDEQTRNPLITTTYGTGQLIKACLHKGVTHIILGLGGSATNDGGAGMAQALGVRLLDSAGVELPPGGAALQQLNQIDLKNIDPRLAETKIEVACDVTNPLCGAMGASQIFGPQKGATPQMIEILDSALSHYADVIAAQLGRDVREIAGAGAAGGLGAGLLAFTPARLCRGVDIVIRHTQLHKHIARADWVFTGEGRIDAQTAMGKTLFGVAQVAKAYGKPLVAFAGSLGSGVETLQNIGIDRIVCITPDSMSIEEAMRKGASNMEHAIREFVGSLYKCNLSDTNG